MTITDVQLAQACDCTLPRAANWVDVINQALGVFAIDTPQRVAAFLAQIGHESARLACVREMWGPLPSQLRYEFRADLGNTQPGDGFRYRGRGLIQITGRANYCRVRDGLRTYVRDVPDCEASPELLEAPRWAALSAAWYWQTHGCNELADAGDFDAITRRINGGVNGLADRVALLTRATEALA